MGNIFKGNIDFLHSKDFSIENKKMNNMLLFMNLSNQIACIIILCLIPNYIMLKICYNYATVSHICTSS